MKIYKMSLNIPESDAKYLKNVIRACSIVLLLCEWLLLFLYISKISYVNLILLFLSIIFVVHNLVIVRTDKIGTKIHLRSGIILVGTYLFNGLDFNTIALSLVVVFATLILYINGREIQNKNS